MPPTNRTHNQPPGEFTCPDCRRRCAGDGSETIYHPPGCPGGHASRAVARSDAAWFADHPWTTHRWRPLHLPEFAELAAVGIDTVAPGRWQAMVQLHPDGLLRRLYRDRTLVLRVTDVVEVAR